MMYRSSTVFSLMACTLLSCESIERQSQELRSIDPDPFKGVQSITHYEKSTVILLDSGNHIDTSYFVLISSYLSSMYKIDISENSITISSPSDNGYTLSTNQCTPLINRTKSKFSTDSNYAEHGKYFLSNFTSKDCLHFHALLMIIGKDVFIGKYTSLLAIIDGLSKEDEERASCAVISVASDISRFPKFGIDSLLFQRMRSDLCP